MKVMGVIGMNQKLWKDATYNQRLNFIRKLELERTKDANTRCNIEILPDYSAANSFYVNSDDCGVIYLKRSLINSGSFFEVLEAYNFAAICAKQDYLRHNPDKCKSLIDAVRYEIGCEVRYSDIDTYLGSKIQEEARQGSFDETKKFCLLNGDRDTPEFKSFEAGYLEWERLVSKRLNKKFDGNHQKTIEYESYIAYQKKVSDRQIMLKKENETIERELTKLKEEYQDQPALPIEAIKEIDQLKQQLEQNNTEINRLATEKTLNPKLGKAFEVYHEYMGLVKQEIDTFEKMTKIEKDQVSILSTNPNIMELVYECKKKYVQLKQIEAKIEEKSIRLNESAQNRKESKGISKLNPIPVFKEVDLKMDIAELNQQFNKANQEFEKIRDKVSRVQSLLSKQHVLLLKKNEEYMRLRDEIRKVRDTQKVLLERVKDIDNGRSSVNHQDLGSKVDFKTGSSGMKMA